MNTYTPNLPNINPLRVDQSTYITFSTALNDFDKADSFGEPWYFSKAVFLSLPEYKSPDFYADLSSIGITDQSPNVVFCKLIQYYMENQLRQELNDHCPYITELAFYKTLNYLCNKSHGNLGRKMITFANSIVISNFISSETSTAGWGEIIISIPNSCPLLTPVWKKVDIQNIVQGTNTDICLFDNGLKQFLYPEQEKYVLDFDHLIYTKDIKSEFSFNLMLLYYKDKDGIDKLHGVNFINPFVNHITYWDLQTFKQKTNEVSSIGYSFQFNIKTVNNEATLTKVYEEQKDGFYGLFSNVLGKLDEFLESKLHE
jgi:hypothetical protein